MFIKIAIEMGTLIYEIPEKLKDEILIGSLVKVPLQNRKSKGWAVEIINKLPSHIKNTRIKKVIGTSYPKPLISKELIELGKWMSSYYQSSLGIVLNLMVSPIGKTIKVETGLTPTPTPTNFKQLNGKSIPSVITNALQKNEFKSILLYGATRRHIYLRAIEETLSQGKGVILLVPEIDMIAPVFSFIQQNFGERVALFHSKLRKEERWVEWLRIKQGMAQIVVGTQSAIFAPVQKLGLIIVDEEQSTSYKSGKFPKYSTPIIGTMRAKISKCVYIAGSRTPSIETFYNTEIGKSTLVRLISPKKIKKKIRIVDMRREIDPIFSELLQKRLKTYIEKEEKILLFLNRRGWSSFIVCNDCSYLPSCPNCNIPLTYHREKISASSGLKCHYCGYEERAPGYCPQCKGTNLSRKGIGTVQVEQAFLRLFPKVRIFRLDMDVASRKYANRIFKSFVEGDFQVLLGTQLIAKPLEFPEVGLIGVISADTGLNLPDFRGSEHTFSLLTRLIDKGKETILQTNNPKHQALKHLVSNDYYGFYKSEKLARKEHQYPPYSHLVRILLEGTNESVVNKHIYSLQNKLKEKGLNFIGPSLCPIEKKKGKFRYHFLLKVKNPSDLPLNSIVPKDAIIDVDPIELV